MPAEKRRLHYLTIIRLISVIMIVCCHYSCVFGQYNIQGFSNYFLNLTNTDTGKLGVQLFFMVSGAGLICSYENEFRLGTYFRKRWLAIFPLYYLCWLIAYLLRVASLEGRLAYNGSLLRLIWTFLGMDYYVGGMTPTYALVGEWFTGAILLLYLFFPLLRLCYIGLAEKVVYVMNNGILAL